jgi:hypothetical protein
MRIVLCLLLMSTVPATTGAVNATPFTLEPQGGIVVPVMINGTGPHPFLVDSHSSISEDLAAAAGAVAGAVAGVIGQDVLSGLRYTISTFRDLPAVPGRSPWPVRTDCTSP